MEPPQPFGPGNPPTPCETPQQPQDQPETMPSNPLDAPEPDDL